MRVEKSEQEGKTILSITGRIDTKTAPDFQKEIDNMINAQTGGSLDLILDFRNVDYISSAGLRSVLYIQKKINSMQGSNMVIENVNDTVMEVFEMTGFTEFLKIGSRI